MGRACSLLRLFGAGVCVALLGALAACSDDASDLRRWMDEQQKAAPVRAPVAAEPTEFKALLYRGDVVVDPFDSSRLDPAGRDGADLSGVDPRATLPVQERQPLEAMVMVGVVDRGGERLALLRIEGVLQAIRVGQRLGVHGGTVMQISERSLTVSEPVRDAQGRSTRRASTLTLKEAKP